MTIYPGVLPAQPLSYRTVQRLQLNSTPVKLFIIFSCDHTALSQFALNK